MLLCGAELYASWKDSLFVYSSTYVMRGDLEYIKLVVVALSYEVVYARLSNASSIFTRLLAL